MNFSKKESSAEMFSSEVNTTTLLAKEECKGVMNKLNTLQQLVIDTAARQAHEAHELNLFLQVPLPSINFGCGIDLETDNLPNHFAKLWLREEPDEIFFQATHPALVKLRQEQIPRWKRSSRWQNWSENVAQSRYQQLNYLDPSLFPSQNECRNLCQIYMLSCDWYYELLTEAECDAAQEEVYCYQILGLTPTTSEQWTKIALVLAICRLTLSCLDWVHPDRSAQLSTKRCSRLSEWCDLSVMALNQAEVDRNPTVEALRVLIILTSTIFFETDCGLMGGSPQMLKLHRLAIDISERLELHRDPPAYMPPKEKNDRRRMWWALVTNDSHFCATGTASNGPLQLGNSNTKYPDSRESGANYACAAENSGHLDLRSPRSRFELGKFNNRYCHLLAQRRPLATLSDIWKLDKELIAMEASVLPEQRLISDFDLKNFSQRPLQPLGIPDNALRYGQQIFYAGFWHIRSKIHRGLLYTKHSSSPEGKTHINFDAHRDIVTRCSYCMLHLYRHIKLPTAFTSAIASAALTVLLELANQPSQSVNREIRTIVLECLSRLQTDTSPVISRACQVLEYFFEPIMPHIETSRNHEDVSNKRQKFSPSEIFYVHSRRVEDDLNGSYIHVSREFSGPVSEEEYKACTFVGSSRISDAERMRATSRHAALQLTRKPRAICPNSHVPRVTPGHPSTFIDPKALFEFQNTASNPCIDECLEIKYDNCCRHVQESSIMSNASARHRRPLNLFKSHLMTSTGEKKSRDDTHLQTIPNGAKRSHPCLLVSGSTEQV